ncbi:SGNH/GDSL hydrolase family protein [Streptomyces sp. NPDC058685]|uniref:SGNH/GDSL hydrolase family protein n=1 Tax=Streptomyces sp. NPDC058685 TaxID=3346598 RepID=UPI003659CE87
MRPRRWAVLLGPALALALCTPGQASSVPATTPVPAAARPQVVTWAASADRTGDAVADRSHRLVVRTSAGGRGLRIRLSNAFGDRPVTFGAAYAGIPAHGAALVPGSNRRLTFGGSRSVTLAPGDVRYSDPLPGAVKARSSLAISLYVRDAGGPATGHGMALQTSYAAAGDHAAESGADNFGEQTGSWLYLDALTVEASPGTGAVVTLGDSITDGWQSSVDRNRRWPDYLAGRLQAAQGSVRGVANEGISGNKVLADGAGQSALRRLDRDVLSQAGVRTVVVFEGVNDIKAHSGVTAADLIAGYREIAARARAADTCVVGATVLPFKGWSEWGPAEEAVRKEVNDFIRTGGLFDAVADFDRALRSPYDGERLLPTFDGGDHLHPNDKGMQAMADAIDLTSLECAD